MGGLFIFCTKLPKNFFQLQKNKKKDENQSHLINDLHEHIQ